MPCIPLFFGWPDWFYMVAGLAATALLWWRSDGWIRAVVSVVMFGCVGYPTRFAGMHECFEGRPPELLELVFAGIAASLAWSLGRWRWPVPLTFIMLLSAGTFTARALAHSYHSDEITGNPEFSSGRFWHTAITGQLPRDKDKCKQFWESFLQHVQHD